MSIPRLILLIVLSALGGLIVLIMVADCIADITAPPPQPTSTPRPRIGDWTGVGVGEMSNYDGLQLRCREGEAYIYAGRFTGLGQPTSKGYVRAKVFGADKSLVKQFHYTETLPAFLHVNKSAGNAQGGRTILEWSYRIGDTRDFIDALLLGASVEMSFGGETSLGLSQTWETKSDRIDGLSEAVEFLRCGI